MTRRSLALAAAVGLMIPVGTMAHGVRYTVSQHGAVIVAATFDDGRPMAYCDAAVYSPAAPDIAYQAGDTDPAGRFAFVPDTHGNWRVSVDDGMGHHVVADVSVDPGHMVPAGGSPRAIKRPLALLIGLSLIFGCFGIYALARQATGHTRRQHGCGGEDCACTSPKV